MLIRSLGALLLVTLVSSPAAGSHGLVIESVDAGGSADRAGLLPGDLLLGWRSVPAGDADPGSDAAAEPRGVFHSPFELEELELERGTRAVTILEGRRDGMPFSRELRPGQWGIDAHPYPVHGLLDDDVDPGDESTAETSENRLIRLQTLAEKQAREGDPLVSVWLHFEAATVLLEVGRWDDARSAMETGITLADTVVDTHPLLGAQTRERLAAHSLEREDFAHAESLLREALRLRGARPDGAESLGAARNLGRLGQIARMLGDFERARSELDRALRIAEQHAPDSLVTAEILGEMAVISGLRGAMDSTFAQLRRALAIQERLDARGSARAQTLNRLGLASRRIGDLGAAADHYRRALEIQQRLDPDGPAIAALSNNLGVLAMKQGDLHSAETYFWRALELSRARAPEGLATVGSLANLGSVFESRGDFELATRYQRRALEIVERSTPESPQVAILHDSLGNLALARRDLETAETHYRRALALRRREMPEGSGSARSWRDLGAVALEQGALGEAEIRLQQALDIERRTTPGSLDLAHTLGLLGRVASLRDRIGAAEAYFLEALDIHQQLAPGTLAEAETCRHLAELERRRGRADRAKALYLRGIAALEAQLHRLGGSYLERSAFAASRASLYTELLDLRVEDGELAEAFHLLERSRSRAFLELIGQREMRLAETTAPELDRRRRLADARYDALLGRLARHPGHSPDETDGLLGALREARHEQQEIKAQIRATEPRLAALRYPEPLDLASTQKLLEPGSLLLAYALGEQRGHLLVVDRETIRAVPIPSSRAELAEEIGRFRELLRPGRTIAAVRFRAARLGELLLGTLSGSIERYERLLILPDGPLHGLPFAALVLGFPDGRERYLIEAKPLTVAASATVFGQLVGQRRERGDFWLTGFGDPLYPALEPTAQNPSPDADRAFAPGLELGPLPATRAELESLAELFPQTSEIHLGAAASEERAKALGTEDRAIHFACHGVTDDRHPLESALVLSLPPEPQAATENGLLQAWEIFEQVRIDAELVTLSACDTALGKELAGEGMIGLTRAFQYAGARSVLASLWGVNDASTARLMESFYRAWKTGKSKDEALRDAQLSFLADAAGDTAPAAHPFYWAAFTLFGDWR